MKRLTLIILVFMFMLFTSSAQNNVGINDDNSSPKPSAMLDVYSASKGMLIPHSPLIYKLFIRIYTDLLILF